MKSLHMTFLAIHAPDRSPSQRYRIEQYFPYLESVNIDTKYAWVLSPDDAKVLYATGLKQKLALGVRSLFRRGVSLAEGVFEPPDVYFVQRESFFLGPDWSERIAKKRAPLIYDFDDAIWMPAISETNRTLSFLKFFEKIPKIIARADVVIAGNAYLAEYANQFSRNVVVIPTVIDTRRYVPSQKKSNDRIIIGWSGSPSTVQHFKLAIPVLERIQKKYGDRVEFVLSGDPSFRSDTVKVRTEAWSSSTEVATVQNFDIGIMPVADDEWSKGKCGLKGLTYMACAVPTVMSPVGVSTEIAADGKFALCASTDDEWFDVLCELIEKENVRAQLGKAGRQRVVSDYSVERWAPEIERIIRKTSERR